MNGFEAIAASLTDVADWAENEMAAGEPPKHVAQHAAERTRQIAYAATMAARGRITPDDLGGMLLARGDDAGGETLMLGRPGVKPSARRWGLRAVRQLLDRAWARAWLWFRS